MQLPEIAHSPGSRRIIALLSDFGTRDHYVGVMKAVIAGIAPETVVIDISHEVPPQSVLAAQYLLRASYAYLPAGAIYLVVVDPGVGTDRKPMALYSGQRFFVGPDNGIFTPLLQDNWTAVELRNPAFRLPSVSRTFHGRDVFAPAAAHLARGVRLEEFGPVLAAPVRVQPPQPQTAEDGTIRGEIVYVDHFGNLVSNIEGRTGGTVTFREGDYPLQPTYAAVEAGQQLALAGSDGQVEIAVRDGSAAVHFGALPGEPVIWRP